MSDADYAAPGVADVFARRCAACGGTGIGGASTSASKGTPCLACNGDGMSALGREERARAKAAPVDPQWEHYDRFVAFCAQLRLLGATEVSSGALTAKFAGVARPAQPEPDKPAVKLTPEQAREAQRQRELGRG